MTKPKVIIMAGGTGGHIFPALAIAHQLKNQGIEVAFLGSVGGMENEIIPRAGFTLYKIQVTKIYKSRPIAALKSILRMGFAFMEAIALFKRLKPQLVISTGSFISAPGGIAAWLLKIPLVIHEQNAIAGITNRWLAKVADHRLQAFPHAFDARFNPQLVGNPVRQEILAVPAPQERYQKRTGSLRILVIGGSQGALIFNRLLPCVFRKLNMPLDIWHQTGKKSFKLTQHFYKRLNISAKTEAFIEDMAEAYAWADLVISRSGALTVSELYAVGLPALFIPFPHAVNNHQLANAQQMVKAGAALCIEQKQATLAYTTEKLQQWLTQPAIREQLMAQAQIAKKLGFTKASEAVAQICIEIIHRKNHGKIKQPSKK